jgi:hypothetical protein
MTTPSGSGNSQKSLNLSAARLVADSQFAHHGEIEFDER